MKIEIGEYVRTDKGTIAKAISNPYEYKDDYKQDFDNEILNDWYCDEKIIKHSPNIIDLIEVGDYVNGSEVLDVMENLKTGKVHLEMTANYTNEELGDCTIYDKDIKSIVTREMFESVKYEV